ncbi:MAG: disulfide bond formation protein B [Burkholderiaceae bacterium]
MSPVLVEGSARQWFAAMALACSAAVGAALVAQHAFDMRPCPWCILQRLIFVAIGLLSLAGAIAQPRAAGRSVAAITLLLAFAAAAAGLYQHFVAARSSGCTLTLADRIVSGLRLDLALPDIFGVTASCADAAVAVFGIPFEFWSVALAAVLGVGSLRILTRP